MPPEVRVKFKNTLDISFDVDAEHKEAIAKNLRSKIVLEKSLLQHAAMCVDNSDGILEAKGLAKELAPDIESRMKRYANCLSHCSKNYREWLIEDYKLKLTLLIGKLIRENMID